MKKRQLQPLSKNARWTVAGTALQLLGNLCFAIATVRVIREHREKRRKCDNE